MNDVYQYGPLPITPGSEVDVALMAVAQAFYSGAGTDESFEASKLIDPSNSAHMLALGTRFYFLKSGVSDPLMLVSEQYGQWFGRPMVRHGQR
jgi:hypothetical protein